MDCSDVRSHLNTIHFIALTCVSAKKQDAVWKLDARVLESFGWATAVVHLAGQLKLSIWLGNCSCPFGWATAVVHLAGQLQLSIWLGSCSCPFGWPTAVVHLQSSLDSVIMPSPNFCQHALAVRCVLFHDLGESDARNT